MSPQATASRCVVKLPAMAQVAASGKRVGASVSVIIPTYNCADYIAGALHSVAKQCYANIEIIVVDDGSVDATQAAIAGSGVPCNYVKNERAKGPSGARNHGILLSQGEFVAFLDADDAWLKNKLTTQMNVMLDHPELVALGAKMIPWDSLEEQTNIAAGKAISSLELLSFEQMILRNRLCTPTVICRRDALATVGLFDENLSISEDYELWMRLSTVGSLGCLNTPLARFRQRPEGLSAGNRDRTYELDMSFARSLPSRYPRVRGMRQMVQRGLAARALDRAIELCDVERRYGLAFKTTLSSLRHWPWSDPLNLNRPFPRLRRLRRITLDAIAKRSEQKSENRQRAG